MAEQSFFCRCLRKRFRAGGYPHLVNGKIMAIANGERMC